MFFFKWVSFPFFFPKDRPRELDKNRGFSRSEGHLDQDASNKLIPRYGNFFRAPKVRFIYEHLFFVLFLMLFSYTLLCKLSYHEDVADKSNSTHTNLSGLDTESVQNSIGTPVWQEYLLCFWILGMIFEEFLQVLNLDCALLLQAEFSKSIWTLYGF